MKNLKFLLVFIIAFTAVNISHAQFYMNSTGNVSIGSTSATNGSTFQSYGGALFSSASSGSASAAYIYVNPTAGYSSASTPEYTWFYDGGTGMYHPAANTIGFTVNSSQVMGLTSSGWNEASFYNTNTSTSQYPLAVSSYVDAQTTLTWNLVYVNGGTNHYNFYVYGAGYEYAVSNNTISDRRLKQNINTITGALSKVMQLRGVTYNFIPQDSSAFYKKVHVGLIAQEVQKVVPEAVNTGKDSIMGIEYGNLVGLLVEAMKEQNKRIDSLKTALNDCCTKNQNRPQRQQPDSGGSGSTPNNSPDIQQGMLYQNTPNPFTQATTITCFIPQQSNNASLFIFDMNGGLQKSLPIAEKNRQNIVINGNELKPGMYFYTLIIDGKEIDTKKMILTQ